jgi:prepilin peptidase CpaA
MSFLLSSEFRSVAVVTIALIAVTCDVRTRRIPNWLTLSGAVAAVLYGVVAAGLYGFGQALFGWIVGAMLFFPLFALRGMGAGDVKLVAALGAWLGPVEAVYLAIFVSIAGGVAGLIVSVLHGYVKQAFSNLWLMLMHWRTAGPGPVPGLTLQDARAPRLAFAIPIALGLVCTLWRR